MKGYFRLKRGALVDEVIINGEAIHTENKELGLLKKRFDLFRFKNNDMEVHE
jgi:hypothetical protein